MTESNNETREEGTFTYENWHAALGGRDWESAIEYPLFTDARIKGAIVGGLGPHLVLNCIAEPQHDPARPALMLRIEYRVRETFGDMSKTLAATYHGGTASDEIAALLSLCLGVRLKSG